MNFSQAYKLMKAGQLIKRPGWGGYWKINSDGKFEIRCKDNTVLTLNEIVDEHLTFSNICENDWETVHPTEYSMTFSEALECLKQGKQISKSNWDEDTFIWYKPEFQIKSDWCKDSMLKEVCEDNGGTIIGHPHISIKNSDGTINPWTPSCVDLFSEDYFIY